MGARALAAAELVAPPSWSTLLRGEALSVGMQQQVQAEGLHASAERGRGRLIPGDVRLLGCQQLAAPVDAAKGGGCGRQKASRPQLQEGEAQQGPYSTELPSARSKRAPAVCLQPSNREIGAVLASMEDWFADAAGSCTSAGSDRPAAVADGMLRPRQAEPMRGQMAKLL